jgi:hypothetical protein
LVFAAYELEVFWGVSVSADVIEIDRSILSPTSYELRIFEEQELPVTPLSTLAS